MISQKTAGLARGTFYHIFARLVFLLSGYAVHIYLGRKLGPQLYGTAGVIITTVLLIRIFMITGLNQAVSKLTAQYSELAGAIKKKALLLQTLVALITGTLLFLCSNCLATLLNDSSLAPYFRVCAFIIPLLGVYSVYQAILSGLRHFGKHAFMIVLFSIVRVIAVIFLVAMGYGIYGLLGGWITAIAVATVPGFFHTMKTDNKGSFQLKKLFLFSLPLVMFSLGNALLVNLDLLFVKSLIPDGTQAGFYTAAVALAKTPYNIFTAFTLTVLPSLSMATGNNDKILTNKYISQSMRYLLMMTVPLAYFVSFSAERLIVLLYPQNFAPAGVPLSILIWGQTFIALFAVLSAILIGTGKPFPVVVTTFSLIPVNIILNMALIPRYGMAGASFATLITAFSGMAVLTLIISVKHCSPFKLISLIRICLAGLVSSSIIYILPLKGLLIVPAYIIAGLVYAVLLIVLREAGKEDLSVLMNMIKRKEART